MATEIRPTVTYKPMSDGTAGTIEALTAMKQAVLKGFPPEYSGYEDPFNQSYAKALTAYQYDGEPAAALYRFCRDEIAYIDHPWNQQVVQDSKRTILLRTGDCVSKSVCLSTLLASLSRLSRFVAQASTPDGFDHVYVEAWVAGKWVALDPTADGLNGRPRGDVGWTQTLHDGGFEMAFAIF